MPAKTTSHALHMIGNAHLNPVWLWQWPDGLQEAKATFRAALDRRNETEDFVFTSSSAALYEWVEENEPGLFAEIRQRVAEGRWRIAGGWWIQPDGNLPSGESFVRQGLYGQRYFKEKLGVTATVGYNVDSFGHSGMLPQFLAKSGMDSYVFMRPEPHEKELPGRLFWWEADDGSRVDVLLRRRQPRQRPHPREPDPHPGAERRAGHGTPRRRSICPAGTARSWRTSPPGRSRPSASRGRRRDRSWRPI